MTRLLPSTAAPYLLPKKKGANVIDEVNTDLMAKLAEVLSLTRKYTPARETLQEALALVRAHDGRQAAKLYASLGRIEVADHNHDKALAAFDRADGLLGRRYRGTGPGGRRPVVAGAGRGPGQLTLLARRA